MLLRLVWTRQLVMLLTLAEWHHTPPVRPQFLDDSVVESDW